MLPMINIPLYYISKTICEFLGNPRPQYALNAYNSIIDSIAYEIQYKENDDGNDKNDKYDKFEFQFESTLFQKNLDLIKLASENFEKDFATLNGVSFDNNESRKISNIQVLLGDGSRIIRNIDSETKNPISVTLKDFLPDLEKNPL